MTRRKLARAAVWATRRLALPPSAALCGRRICRYARQRTFCAEVVWRCGNLFPRTRVRAYIIWVDDCRSRGLRLNARIYGLCKGQLPQRRLTQFRLAAGRTSVRSFRNGIRLRADKTPFRYGLFRALLRKRAQLPSNAAKYRKKRTKKGVKLFDTLLNCVVKSLRCAKGA